MSWILMVVTTVYGGSTVTFQEFSNQKACLDAEQTLRAMVQVGGMLGNIRDIKCVPKGGTK